MTWLVPIAAECLLLGCIGIGILIGLSVGREPEPTLADVVPIDRLPLRPRVRALPPEPYDWRQDESS